jgi:hypothetical protein
MKYEKERLTEFVTSYDETAFETEFYFVLFEYKNYRIKKLNQIYVPKTRSLSSHHTSVIITENTEFDSSKQAST